MLNEYLKRAIAAHQGTSFSPERRGEQLIKEFTELLEADLKEIGPENHEQYATRYKRYLSDWLGAKSRCLSSMITGPARFPVERNRKANEAEHRKYETFMQWREKAKKAIARQGKPQYSNQAEIDKYKAKLATCIKSQEFMKAVNAIVRKTVDNSVKIEAINLTVKNMGLNIGPDFAQKILSPDYCGRIGFASYALTNNNAEIHRLEGRIKELEAKAKAEAEAEAIEAGDPDAQANQYPIKGGNVVLNFKDNRIQVFFYEKPDEDMRNQLKRKAFKWAPSQSAWQRQITVNAIYDTNCLFEIKIPRI